MKNISASIKAKLQNQARAEKIQLNHLLESFALSRFFARLSESEYADSFILKGAQLFTLWSGSLHRPTRDADFLSFGSASSDDLQKILENICQIQPRDSDGLEWEIMDVFPIREDNCYGGVRGKLTALLGTIRIPVQIDVGFGDSITPEAVRLAWSMPLGFKNVTLLTYQAETSIAEKLHAAVELETTNSRMKDFYDLYWLCQHFDFKGNVLQSAIHATFKRRDTEIPKQTPLAFTHAFYSREDKMTQWSAFLRKNKLTSRPLNEIMASLDSFLTPVLLSQVTSQVWTSSEGWAPPHQSNSISSQS